MVVLVLFETSTLPMKYNDFWFIKLEFLEKDGRDMKLEQLDQLGG